MGVVFHHTERVRKHIFRPVYLMSNCTELVSDEHPYLAFERNQRENPWSVATSIHRDFIGFEVLCSITINQVACIQLGQEHVSEDVDNMFLLCSFVFAFL